MNVITVSVSLQHHAYDVILGEGVLDMAGLIAREKLKCRRTAIVTDSHVGPLYAEPLEAALRVAHFEPICITVPAGEASKSLARTEEICVQMTRAGLDRHACVFALGGGVVGDLAGFAASIFYRGVPVIQLPTTIVSLVDSAVGGKTGVNTSEGKNLIGTFHQPSLVLADPQTLETLPVREYCEGFAEVIKHAAIRDAAMLPIIDEVLVDRGRLTELIAANVRIKSSIVQVDEKERLGLREFLNFGHTIGHAIESVAGYGTMLHGEAISLGLRAALDLSRRHAGLSVGAEEAVLRRLAAYGLPLVLSENLKTEAIITTMTRDKKFESGAIRFVLLRALGDPMISSDLTLEDVRGAVKRLRMPLN